MESSSHPQLSLVFFMSRMDANGKSLAFGFFSVFLSFINANVFSGHTCFHSLQFVFRILTFLTANMNYVCNITILVHSFSKELEAWKVCKVLAVLIILIHNYNNI